MKTFIFSHCILWFFEVRVINLRSIAWNWWRGRACKVNVPTWKPRELCFASDCVACIVSFTWYGQFLSGHVRQIIISSTGWIQVSWHSLGHCSLTGATSNSSLWWYGWNGYPGRGFTMTSTTSYFVACKNLPRICRLIELVQWISIRVWFLPVASPINISYASGSAIWIPMTEENRLRSRVAFFIACMRFSFLIETSISSWTLISSLTFQLLTQLQRLKMSFLVLLGRIS